MKPSLLVYTLKLMCALPQNNCLDCGTCGWVSAWGPEELQAGRPVARAHRPAWASIFIMSWVDGP